MNAAKRIGLIVPSSNVTMETEIPALLRRQKGAEFTFHSSRMRMRKVTPEELAAMNAEGDRCVRELSDARCDILAYACLVAVMASGPGAHMEAEYRLSDTAREEGSESPVVTSAGALLSALSVLGAKRIALVAPYLKPLTQLVVSYIEDSGFAVADAISLEVADNCAVGRLDPMHLVGHAGKLNLNDVDAIVLSACVQMPSLAAIQIVEDRLGLPVVSAATATAYDLIGRLGMTPNIAGAGKLMSGIE